MKNKYAKVGIALASLLLISTNFTKAADVPPTYVDLVTVNEGKVASKADIAFNNIYALNDSMFNIYDKSLALYKTHFKERHPLIMALFSGKGGRFILYRPGQAPLEAPSPPQIYRAGKAVGHCAMATYTLLAPYAKNAEADLSWKGDLLAYRTRVQTALDSLNDADISAEDRTLLADTLKQIIAFHDQCLKDNSYTYADIEKFAHSVKPNLAKLIEVCSGAQVGHWWKVMEDWKKLLGADWDHTFALSNSIYVTRQNNILFTILVNFMGKDAMNDRLLLLETTDFTATPDTMMDAFIRIISDRAIGEVFYKNYRLMDFELLGGGARKAIDAEAAKRGRKAIQAPLVPFNSHGWPWKTDPSTGSGPATLDEVH
jgi:hypothetical protein